MTRPSETLRYTAFPAAPSGGNRAGVVLDASTLSDGQMLAIAAELGYSESAFVTDGPEPGHYRVRYFSPQAEVPFCGHATIAAAVALAEHTEEHQPVFHTRSGEVALQSRVDADGALTATLASVPPKVEPARATLLEPVLAALRWAAADLDPGLPPRVAFAGARHLVLAAATRERLATLDYDFHALREPMLAFDLTTVALIWRESDAVFHARNPFPVGGVVEDPATGAAAAALGAYLRELGAVVPPATLTVLQGADMGRPSRLTVDIGAEPSIRVSGTALRLDD